MMTPDNPHRYDDMLYMDRPITTNTPLSAEQRAAQFMPFSAVVGYDDKVKESARVTSPETILSQSEQDDLNRKLQFLADHLQERYPISITVFVPDSQKEGGSYHTFAGILRRIDFAERQLHFYAANGVASGFSVPMGCVVALECEEYAGTVEK